MFILIFMCQIKLINFVMFLLHVKYLIWIILSQPAGHDLVLKMSHLNFETAILHAWKILNENGRYQKI